MSMASSHMVTGEVTTAFCVLSAAKGENEGKEHVRSKKNTKCERCVGYVPSRHFIWKACVRMGRYRGGLAELFKPWISFGTGQMCWSSLFERLLR